LPITVSLRHSPAKSSAANVRPLERDEQPMPTNPQSFDAKRYWSNRLEQTFSLEGVGYLGLGEEYNRWMYAVRRSVFRSAVRGLIDPPRGRILDVGSGTGFYVKLWRELGARDVTGSDLTAVAVEQLTRRFPEASFRVLDLTQPLAADQERFDAISAMDVLFHIVDDDGYARAIDNLGRMLAPGGILVFTENLPHGRTDRGEHQTSRSLESVSSLLAHAGLAIELRRPVFVLMNTPVDSDSTLLERSWKAVNILVRGHPRRGWAVGAVLYPLELLLGRLVKEGPSTEIVVCRKPGAASH
jgi:SAM-dependent methyltransferase